MADYDIGKAFERIEDELISSMIRNLKHHRAMETEEGIQWSQWQAEQLKALEAYKKENLKKFSPEFEKINNDISNAINKAYETGGMEQEIKILSALKKGYRGYKNKFRGTTSVEGNFFKVNERKLNQLIDATVNDMKKAEHAVLRMTNDKYRKIIFDAQVYANAGGTTYEKAVDMATHDFLSAGINCVEYKNGARHTISDYADMAIRTANKRAYLRGEGTKRAEWGISTVIINKRGNACPLCMPFVGKVFIDDVYSGGNAKDGDYPLLSSAISAGFLHPRCKDVFTTYFEGISTPPKEQQLTQDEVNEIKEKTRIEQNKSYAENQAKKMDRLSKYSLDEDNKKAYSHRADVWQDKAEKTAQKLDETVAKSAESGIIELNRKIERREKNTGAFANLEIPMQKRYVLDLCKKYNIDTKGITFKIQRSENLLKLEYYGITDPDNIGRIDLLPNAFTNEDQLIRTVIHEKCHVKQLNKYGKKYVQDNLADMEKQAYKFEDVFYNILKRKANL